MSLPKIVHPTALNRLNAAIEKARGTIMHSGTINPQPAYDAVIRDAQELEPILTTYGRTVAAIKGNRKLSAEGIQDELDKALEEITTQLSKLDKTASLAEGCRNCEAIVFNTIRRELDENKPKDVMLDYLQTSEMRQYLHRTREEAKREHEAWLAEQEKEGRPVPDQMRTFHDPVEHLFLESCRGYAPEKDQLYRAITEAPFPVQLLPADTIQKGRALLESKVAPVQVENLAQARARLAMYTSLWESALKLAEKPETLQPYHEPRKILSDEQRAFQASAGGK